MGDSAAWLSRRRGQPVGRPGQVGPHGRLHPIDLGEKSRGGEPIGLRTGLHLAEPHELALEVTDAVERRFQFGVGRDRAVAGVHAQGSTGKQLQPRPPGDAVLPARSCGNGQPKEPSDAPLRHGSAREKRKRLRSESNRRWRICNPEAEPVSLGNGSDFREVITQAITTEPADPALAQVVEAWSSLPPAVRAGILAMVEASR